MEKYRSGDWCADRKSWKSHGGNERLCSVTITEFTPQICWIISSNMPYNQDWNLIVRDWSSRHPRGELFLTNSAEDGVLSQKSDSARELLCEWEALIDCWLRLLRKLTISYERTGNKPYPFPQNNVLSFPNGPTYSFDAFDRNASLWFSVFCGG